MKCRNAKSHMLLASEAFWEFHHQGSRTEGTRAHCQLHLEVGYPWQVCWLWEVVHHLDPSYNPNDEAKELTDKFTLLEKHSISSRCPVSSKAEWMHLFDIWVSVVLHFYPHQRVELASYCDLIVNMFQATLSPLSAIKYDQDSREQYSQQPYHLDSSKDILPFPLLSQLLSLPLSSPSSSGGKKKSLTSQEDQHKHSEMICQNWNLGSCDGDTCGYGCKHNQCSKCNEHHWAKDKQECLTALNKRCQQQRMTAACSSRT